MNIVQWLWPTREFRLPPFEPAPLAFDRDSSGGTDVLLRDAVDTAVGTVASSQSGQRPVATAGELHARIERHLQVSRDGAADADAAQELRNALAELRRSVR